MFASLAIQLLAPAMLATVDSGIKVGDMVPAFDPMHVAGPDKGTNTCPT